MIYDLIELPMRDISGELSSVMPKFTYMHGVDDIDWYGRSVDLGMIKQSVHKYKSIEPMGQMTIERIFMAPEPIDFKKKWLTANIDLFPIMYKVYRYPYTATCDVYRYINGTNNVLGQIGQYEEMQTIDNKLMRMMIPYGCGEYLPKHTLNMIPHVTYGNDETNLNNYTTMKEFMSGGEDGDSFFYVESPLSVESMFPPIPKDVTENMFLRDLKVSNLKPLVTTQCANGIIRKNVSTETPFDINNKTMFGEDCENYRWVLHKLIHLIESSVYTDMHIKLIFETQHKVKAETDMYSRYIGLTAVQIPGAKQAIREISEYLRKWVCMTTKGTPTSVELWKNWMEEIFISVKTEKDTYNYYFDIATYSLTNLSFVDMIG